MNFEISRFKNQKIETGALIEDLKIVSQKIKKTPTIDEYNNNGQYEASVYIRRFGSWNEALKIAGLPPNNQQWKESDLLENLISVWLHLGKQPTRRDMDNKQLSKISSGTYLRFYGTWINALEASVAYANTGVYLPTETLSDVDTTSHKTHRDINLRLRFVVMKRDNFKCCMCGRSPSSTPDLELHIDHIIPWSKGGETVIENLQTLCKDCNLGKSNL